jgi:translation initiation factor IF-3
VPRVRLVGAGGEQYGIMPTAEALHKARGLDLDLVEVAPNADPPVCRIMDYGKYKYIQSKREAEARKKQTVIQVKEIKVRPKTDEHDRNVKIRHIRRFLEEGDKVKVTVRFRGRELSYASQSGFEILKGVIEAVSDISKVESPPRMEGRTMTAIVAPTAQKKKATGPPAGSPGAPDRHAPAGAGSNPPEAGALEERTVGKPAENQEGRNA